MKTNYSDKKYDLAKKKKKTNFRNSTTCYFFLGMYSKAEDVIQRAQDSSDLTEQHKLWANSSVGDYKCL